MIHKPRPIQYFTPEYLEQCKQLSSQQIVQFLDDFKQLVASQYVEQGKKK
jgi:hypothetical protein